MKIFIKIAVVVGMILLVSGCGKPQPTKFSKYSKGIVFMEGKPYAVPIAAPYRLITKPFDPNNRKKKKVDELPKNDRIRIAYYHQRAVTCKVGEISWWSSEVEATLKVEINKYNKELAAKRAEGLVSQHKIELQIWEAEYSYNMSRRGQIGCAKPLSDQEYKYMLNQQNQQRSDNRASADRNLQKSLNRKPKKVDVNVYHY